MTVPTAVPDLSRDLQPTLYHPEGGMPCRFGYTADPGCSGRTNNDQHVSLWTPIPVPWARRLLHRRPKATRMHSQPKLHFL